jgi:glutamine---fructose-6-phosphate transaminase (isomerizing)
MQKTPYITDILSQPDLLKRVIPLYDFAGLEPQAAKIKTGEIKRIFITGMGGSLAAAHAAWLILARQGLPVYLVDCAEMLHNTSAQITPDSLVWLISQSGRSAELVKLVEIVKSKHANLIVTTNDLESPLAQAAQAAMSILSPIELTVSTMTFTTSLASIQLAAMHLCRLPIEQAREDLLWTADQCGLYLSGWEGQVEKLEKAIGLPKHLVVLGRGLSLSAVNCGSLVQMEAAKLPVLPMNAGEFRHGPLELCNPDLTMIVMGGETYTRELNKRLCEELIEYKAQAFWMDAEPESSLPRMDMPAWRGIGQPIAEIIPMQLLSIAIANIRGIEAGKFIRSGKITLTE